MSDTDLPAQNYLADEDEDEQAPAPGDENQPTDDDPATSADLGTAQTVTNDAVAGEPVGGGIAEDDIGSGLIEPIYAENDLADEGIDLEDTVEWSVEDDAGAEPDLGPLSDYSQLSGYDALTDADLSGAQYDPDRIDITEHEGPDLTAENDIDSGAGQGEPR